MKLLNEVKIMKKYEKPELDVTPMFRNDIFTASGNDNSFDLEDETFD